MLSAAENAAASRIVRTLKGHTLALKLTRAYAADSHRSLASIALELEKDAPSRRIKTSVDSQRNPVFLAFRQSVRDLSNDERSVFGLFAIFRSLDIGRNAILDVAQAVGIDDGVGCLDKLVRRAFADARLNNHVPVPVDRDRIVLHPLLRALAGDSLNQSAANQQGLASRAAAQYYADYIGLVSERWLAPDEANIIGALEWVHHIGEHELVSLLCDGMRPYWERRGRASTSRIYLAWGEEAAGMIARESDNHDDWRRATRLALAYASALLTTWQFDSAETIFMQYRLIQKQIGDRRRESVVLTSMGLLAKAQARLAEAKKYFEQALAISAAVNDIEGHAANLMYLGQVAQARGQISDAEDYYQQALILFGDSTGTEQSASDGASSDLQKAETEDTISSPSEQIRGSWRDAEALFQQSLSIQQENNDLVGEAVVVSLLGQLCIARGDFPAAETYLRKSLDLRRESEDRYGEAVDLSQFGRLYLDKGDFAQSRQYFHDSLAIFRDLHIRADEGVVLSQLALVAIEQRHYQEADELLNQSLRIRREVQDQRGEGVDLALLGRIALEQEQFDKAESLYSHSLDIAHEIENRRGEGVDLRQLGVIAEHHQRFQFAVDYYRESLSIAHDVENGGDIADASLALGSLLCSIHQGSEEGCALLYEAAELYARMKVPGEQKARDAMKRFGCAE